MIDPAFGRNRYLQMSDVFYKSFCRKTYVREFKRFCSVISIKSVHNSTKSMYRQYKAYVLTLQRPCTVFVVIFLKQIMNTMVETNRLIMRPWTMHDADALYKYASDRSVSEPAQWPCHDSVEMSLKVIEEFFIPFKSNAIILKTTKEPIGCIGLVPQGCENYNVAVNEREIGYWLGCPYWGQGLMTEALKAMTEYYHKSTHLKSLLITTRTNNVASQRVAEKCGFVFIGEYETDGELGKAYRLNLT